jgi:tRNA 2-selenouridine synthase
VILQLKKILISQFLEQADHFPVVDVRSPSEFNGGHVPGAFNIPLFDDRERETVGIKYKKEGREPAILKGLELTGSSLHFKLEKAISISKERKLLVHCWRGGMRSEAMAWLFSQGDIDCQVLEGGYKAYRNHLLRSLSAKRMIIVLGGMTGSGKTHILRHLKKTGKQVLDLEGIANHKGSAFGALGEDPQPSTEHFANLLFDEWRRFDDSEPVWLEDESRNIGTVFLPDTFYRNMQEAPTVVLKMPAEVRIPGLAREYSGFPPDELKSSILKISRRLGGDNTKEALKAVDEGNFTGAISLTLKYYDKTYLFGLSRKEKENQIIVETYDDNVISNALKVLEAAREIKW